MKCLRAEKVEKSMLEKARESLDGIVDIRQFKVDKSLKDALPIPGIKSRICSAIIFGYLNKKKKVIAIVNVLNKSGRAYIVTQIGLPGFLTPHYPNLASLMFSELNMTHQFTHGNDYRLIYNREAKKSLADDLSARASMEDKMEYLKSNHPQIIIEMHMPSDEDFKILEQNVERSILVHMLPKLSEMRREGDLREISCMDIMIDKQKYKYYGEVVYDAKIMYWYATGWGSAISGQGQARISYTGTFVDGKMTGIIIRETPRDRTIVEYWDGKLSGSKKTIYHANGDFTNMRLVGVTFRVVTDAN